MIANKNKELDRLEGIYERILRDNGVALLRGKGRLVDPHTVEVDGTAHTADKILIACGGWPYKPDIRGIEHVITSNEALDLPELPNRIVIVGGGYIAVEFAGIFNALGVEVTQIIRAGALLRGFDQDVRECLTAEMEKKGVRILREAVLRSIEKEDAGFTLRIHGSDEFIETDLVMYATGRLPNTAALGLADAGIKLSDKGAVIVNDDYQSSAESVYAIGDCIDRVQLTPVAIAEGRSFAETHFNGNPTTTHYGCIPTGVFSQPPVGCVGLSEEEARRRGGTIDIYVSRFKPLKHTLTGRDEVTLMKLVVDRDSERVLGCHMVGPDAPEIIQGMAVALECGVTKTQLDATVGIHPTAAEEFVTMRDKRPEDVRAAAE